MSRRAFLRTWAAHEMWVSYPDLQWSIPNPVMERFIPNRWPIEIEPMTIVAVPGQVYSLRSVRLGA